MKTLWANSQSTPNYTCLFRDSDSFSDNIAEGIPTEIDLFVKELLDRET